MAIIRRTTIEKHGVKTPGHTLTINEREAQSLLDILGRVGGSTTATIRDDVDELISALQGHGYQFSEEGVLEGFLYAKK